MKKLLLSLIFVCAAIGAAKAQTTYYFSDFNSFPDNATVLPGGSNSLTAYGTPAEFGLIRDDGSGGKALNIYGGQAFNGAGSGAFGALSDRISAGETLLRMTGEYRTTDAFDGTPWAQTASIQFQNTVGFFTYNFIEVSSSTPDWTPFTLDLNIAGVDPGQLGQIQANFFIGGTAAGQFQVDNLTIQTTVPEPSTYALLALGGAGLGAHLIRRRRR
jgi:hypothetical protein